jgi:hypothetical protein
VMQPFDQRSMDFDISVIRNTADLNDRFTEVGSPVRVQCATCDDEHIAAIGSSKGCLSNQLAAPDVAQKSFVKNARTHMRRRETEINAVRPAGTGRTGNYEKNCLRKFWI